MIAILGGSGFIGSRLAVKLTERKSEFVILDIAESKSFPKNWKWCDVRQKDALRQGLAKCSVIINLAAEHKDNVTPRSLYDEVNVQGAANVCDIADELGIKKIIFTSSVAVYGLPEKETDESGAFNYFNDYGRTKLLAEKEYEKWFNRADDRSLLVIRPTVVFGEGNRGNVYNLLAQIASGRFMMIGSGENKKSMVYVENVVALLLRLIDEQGYFVANMVDKPDYSMNELVTAVHGILGRKGAPPKRIPYWLGYCGGLGFDVLSFVTRKKFSVSSVRVKKFCASTQFTSKTMDRIRFNPPIPLSEGLRRTLTSEFIAKNN